MLTKDANKIIRKENKLAFFWSIEESTMEPPDDLYAEKLVENFHGLNEPDKTSFDLAADLHRDAPSHAQHLPYSSSSYPLQDALYQVCACVYTKHMQIHADML